MEQIKQEGGSPFVREEERDHMMHRNNCKDSNFTMEPQLVEHTKQVRENDDAEVNITERRNVGGSDLFKPEHQDTTESSSSFDSSGSGAQNGATSSNAEVVSDFHETTSPFAFDGLSDMLRMRFSSRKKLSSHWRSFIQPLMWRCKWAELKINRLQSQALKYDRELAGYHQKKQFQFDSSSEEGSKSRQFSNSLRDKVLRRKKRRRVEDSSDVAAYLSRHNLFSYYENRMPVADGALDDYDNINDELEFNDEWLESRENDDSPEEMLRSFEILQSHLTKIKTRLDEVLRENDVKFSFVDNSSLLSPSSASTSSDRDTTSPDNGDKLPRGFSYNDAELSSDYKLGCVKPEFSVPSHSKMTNLPEIGDGVLIDNQRINLYIQTGQDFLMKNLTVEEDTRNSEEIKIQSTGQPEAPNEDRGSNMPLPPVPDEPEPPADDQPVPKTCSISKLTTPKRKRRKRRNR